MPTPARSDPEQQRAPRPNRRRPRRLYVTAWSSASPRSVFGLLADVTTWTDWAGSKEADYERTGDHCRDGVGAVRRFRVGALSSLETVLDFVPDRHLAYDYVGSVPFADYRGDVKLFRHRGGTRIEWRAEFTTKYPLTGSLLRWFMSLVLATIAKRLATAAQTRDTSEPLSWCR